MRPSPLWILLAVGVVACGDTGTTSGTPTATDATDAVDSTDSADAADAADGTDGTDATDSTDGVVDGAVDGFDATDGAPDVQQPDAGPTCSCDDNNPCTTDGCDAQGNCVHKAGGGGECVPLLQITSPARGAFITGTDPFEVTGVAKAADGSPALLTVNGQKVPVNADGSFTAGIPPDHGINTFIAAASSSNGYKSEETRAVMVAEAWFPTQKGRGPDTIISDGVQAWLGQALWDDDDQSDLDDFAAITAAILENTDFVAALPPNISGEGETASALWCTWTVDITAIDFEIGDVELSPIPGGLGLEATFENVVVTFSAVAPEIGCPDAGGSATVDAITVAGTVGIALSGNGQLLVDVPALDVQISEPFLDITDGFASFFDWAFNWFNGTFANIAETAIESAVQGYLVPSLQEALEGFTTYTQSLTIPSLGGITKPVEVTFAVEPSTIHTDYDGIRLGLGASVVAVNGLPAGIEPPGSIARQTCMLAGVSPFALTDAAPFALAVADDLLNQLLFGAFYSGVLHLDIPGSLIADKLGFDSLKVDTISLKPLLPPVLTSCPSPGKLTVQVGEFAVSASLELGGKAGTVEAILFASADVQLEAVQKDGTVELGFSIAALDTFSLQVVDAGGALDGSESVIELLFREVASSLVKDAVGGSFLQSFPVPTFDISAFASGLPSMSLTFQPEELGVRDGFTEITGKPVAK